jgi:WxcM-like, C-terminal
MDVSIIHFPKIVDPRGNLTFLQNPDQIPFTMERIFWTYDVPGGEIRGAHAYRTQFEIIIALSGSFEVAITKKNGSKENFFLNRSYYGLYLPPLTWRQMENFSTNSLGLHISSSVYNPDDYIYDFAAYQQFTQ